MIGLALLVNGPPRTGDQSSLRAGDIRDANSYSYYYLNGEGVDTCTHYSSTTWNKFFLKPHMWGLGFYLGGATADYIGCFEPGSTWLNDLNADWRVMPIWDALQAPCSGDTKRMSSDTSTAASQGTTAANNAIAQSNTIGLYAPNIIYLDMEAYDSSCSASVKAYINSWVQTLHSSSYKAGVYGSACAPDMDIYAGLSHPPDDVWIADYNNIDGAAPGDVSCVSQSNWTGGLRIHQYHGTTNESYGGVTVSVDKDCINGQVDGNGYLNDACG